VISRSGPVALRWALGVLAFCFAALMLFALMGAAIQGAIAAVIVLIMVSAGAARGVWLIRTRR
jgi:hypothetical protein